MKNRWAVVVGAVVIVAFVLLLLINPPIRSYTSYANACPMEELHEVRLSLIKGETIGEVKERERNFSDTIDSSSSLSLGCGLPTKYTLHVR